MVFGLFKSKPKKNKQKKNLRAKKRKTKKEKINKKPSLTVKINKQIRDFKNNIEPKIDDIESFVLSNHCPEELKEEFKKDISNYRDAFSDGIRYYRRYCKDYERYLPINDFHKDKIDLFSLECSSLGIKGIELHWEELIEISSGTSKSFGIIDREIKWNQEKTSTKENILRFLKKEGTKLPASDIDFQLKIGNVDLVKKLCEELYRDKKIGRTGNYRYFV